MRRKIAAANWKMNLSLAEGKALVTELLAAAPAFAPHQEAVLGVPFPYLIAIQEQLGSAAGMSVAAQNCYDKNAGAYTGEVSAPMLKSIGVPSVILGHSERREYFGESNAMLAEKVNRCLEQGLRPIFCCGEALDIREQGTQNAYVGQQLTESLFHLSAEQMTGFVIAYEPIWAIGTGKTASSQQAQDMHAHLRSVIADQYGAEIADSVSILYGGSVKANNAVELFSQPDVDGGLVGGASLVATEFAAIMRALP